jgi:Uma2 family endonuclease
MSVTVSHPTVLQLGPGAAGLSLTAAEFDAAQCEPGWRYELIQGVLVVNPAPLAQERSPNQLLGNLLWAYQQTHPNGSQLDDTLPEHDVLVGNDRRRADRVIWAGLGRQPRVTDLPTIVIEFVSAGKRNLMRDYKTKRHEYESIGVREYWVLNRFDRTMTVFQVGHDTTVIHGGDTYRTDLLPGFELPLDRLFAAADRWN